MSLNKIQFAKEIRKILKMDKEPTILQWEIMYAKHTADPKQSLKEIVEETVN
jgi:hypothetical protein